MTIGKILIPPPLVYILVLNYCSFQDTVECVESIRCLTYPNCKLLVLDNDSPDGSGDKLEKVIPQKEFVKLPQNTGYAGGNNYGIEIAIEKDAEYVFIVNPDIRLSPTSLCDYVCAMKTDSKIGGLNPVQLSSPNGVIDRRFSQGVLRFHSHKEIYSNLGKDRCFEVHELFGATLLLSMSCIQKVGLFDPLYFAYGEEIDLCRRIRYFGYKLIVTCKSPVVHLRSYENQPIDYSREFLRIKGKYLYELKDINRCFMDNIKYFIYTMRGDYFIAKREKKYMHYLYFNLKIIFWVIFNIKSIIKSIDNEKKGFSHFKKTS